MHFKLIHTILCLLFIHCACIGQSVGAADTDTLIVNVDNHTIHLYVSGKGKYTIVMESGLGANHESWNSVVSSVSKKAKVVTYDRPGYLQSDSCTKKRDAITVVHELKQALQKAKIFPPYILVGWSLGGSFVRVYAGQFPKDVLGLVLVDPAPEESYGRFVKECPELLYEDSLYVQEVLNSKRVGEKGEVIAYDISMIQARESDSKYSAPIKLLISPYGKAPGKGAKDSNNPVNRIWVEELKKWAFKKQDIEYRIVSDSGHHIAKENPWVVIETILELLEEVKTKM